MVGNQRTSDIQMSQQPSHVLYVTEDRLCPGCRLATAIWASHETDGGNTAVLIQDVPSLMRQNVEIPAWLQGTPTLVNIQTRKVLYGQHALACLPELLIRRAEEVKYATPKQVEILCDPRSPIYNPPRDDPPRNNDKPPDAQDEEDACQSSDEDDAHDDQFADIDQVSDSREAPSFPAMDLQRAMDERNIKMTPATTLGE